MSCLYSRLHSKLTFFLQIKSWSHTLLNAPFIQYTGFWWLMSAVSSISLFYCSLKSTSKDTLPHCCVLILCQVKMSLKGRVLVWRSRLGSWHRSIVVHCCGQILPTTKEQTYIYWSVSYISYNAIELHKPQLCCAPWMLHCVFWKSRFNGKISPDNFETFRNVIIRWIHKMLVWSCIHMGLFKDLTCSDRPPFFFFLWFSHFKARVLFQVVFRL